MNPPLTHPLQFSIALGYKKAHAQPLQSRQYGQFCLIALVLIFGTWFGKSPCKFGAGPLVVIYIEQFPALRGSLDCSLAGPVKHPASYASEKIQIDVFILPITSK